MGAATQPRQPSDVPASRLQSRKCSNVLAPAHCVFAAGLRRDRRAGRKPLIRTRTRQLTLATGRPWTTTSTTASRCDRTSGGQAPERMRAAGSLSSDAAVRRRAGSACRGETAACVLHGVLPRMAGCMLCVAQ
eukprot:354068-Chlamydomonas_euryale.AAC.2